MNGKRSALILMTSACMSALLAIPAGSPAAAEKRVTVQGRVTTGDGVGLEGWPVSLIGTQRYIEFSKYTSGGDVLRAGETRTDVNGYFTIDVPKARGFQFWFVRFLDPATFDAVKYQPPADVEITADARRGRVSRIDTTIRFQKDWSELLQRISEAGGEGTARGKILRTLGLPEKVVAEQATVQGNLGSPGNEEWWYFTRGIVYQFRDGTPTGSRRFEPVVPAAGAPTGEHNR